MPRAAARSVDSTRRFYEEDPQAYADATRMRGLSVVLDEFARALAPAARVLDLGCGAGHDLMSFRGLQMKPVGVDYAEPIVRFAAANGPVVVADIKELPFANASFDAIWASASLHHIARDEVATALAECRRVIVDGGAFFASVKRGSGDYVDRYGRHFSLYRAPEWERALVAAGFHVEGITRNDGFDILDRSRRPVPWLNSLATA